MSLGLYVSSFYFFRSGKNSCYLGLNAPVQYNDTQYSQAIDFFEDFFEVRRTMETLESEKKLYYIETNPNWRGETDKFSYIAACIHSGNYGIESDIYDATSHEQVGSIEKNQAGIVPFFVFVAIPKKETSTEPINKGLILFQSMGIYGTKSITCKMINEFAKDKMNATFHTCNVSPSEFLKAFFDLGTLKRLKLTRNRTSEDNSDQLSGISYAREERVLSSFLGRAANTFIERLIRFGLDKSAIFELENGISYDNVTATIDIGDGKERTVNLHKYDNLSILEYIPSQYEKENGHADENTIIFFFPHQEHFASSRHLQVLQNQRKNPRQNHPLTWFFVEYIESNRLAWDTKRLSFQRVSLYPHFLLQYKNFCHPKLMRCRRLRFYSLLSQLLVQMDCYLSGMFLPHQFVFSL